MCTANPKWHCKIQESPKLYELIGLDGSRILTDSPLSWKSVSLRNPKNEVVLVGLQGFKPDTFRHFCETNFFHLIPISFRVTVFRHTPDENSSCDNAQHHACNCQPEARHTCCRPVFVIPGLKPVFVMVYKILFITWDNCQYLWSNNIFLNYFWSEFTFLAWSWGPAMGW